MNALWNKGQMYNYKYNIYPLVKALLQGNISQGWSQEAHTVLVQYK